MKRQWTDIFDSVLTVLVAVAAVAVIFYAVFVWWYSR